jgi:hypothetical protein
MFEHALEECLTRMRLEGATPEECLAQYPQFRLELAPLLIAAQDLGTLDSLEPRPEFRSQTRARLISHMRANPRRRETWYGSLAFKYAASLALLFVTLAATGTALAQNALPGDTLFGWKLASERIWYSLHRDPLDADIYLSGRRVTEIQAIRGRANLEEIGVGAYTAVLQQLSLDLAQDPEKAISISELLNHQREQLKEIIESSQANIPELDEIFGIVTIPRPADNPGKGPENAPDIQLPLVIPTIPLTNKNENNSSNSNSENSNERGVNPVKNEHKKPRHEK